jgi:hypothetical protein
LIISVAPMKQSPWHLVCLRKNFTTWSEAVLHKSV